MNQLRQQLRVNVMLSTAFVGEIRVSTPHAEPQASNDAIYINPSPLPQCQSFPLPPDMPRHRLRHPRLIPPIQRRDDGLVLAHCFPDPFVVDERQALDIVHHSVHVRNSSITIWLPLHSTMAWWKTLSHSATAIRSPASTAAHIRSTDWPITVRSSALAFRAAMPAARGSSIRRVS